MKELRWTRRAAVLLAAVLAGAGMVWAAAAGPSPGGARAWHSAVPPLVAVTLALATGRVFLSLGAAVVLGGALSALGRPAWDLKTLAAATGAEYVGRSLADADNRLILLFVVLVMAMISVTLCAGGLQGIAARLARLARTPRSTQLATAAAGLAVFIDDYANTMIVGPMMRPLADRARTSREKLAFLVDATAAPVAGIAVVSTWIGVEVGLLGQIAGDLGVGKDGYAVFFDAVGARFYCLGMIAFVLLNAATGADFGPMARAERRARTLGKLLDDGARPLASAGLAAAEAHPRARVRALSAVLPLAVLLGAFLGGLWMEGGLDRLIMDPRALLCPADWRAVLRAADSIPILAGASAAGLAAAVLLALAVARVPATAIPRAAWMGLRASLAPAAVLVLAWSLKAACDALGTGPFLAESLQGRLAPWLFPATVFVVAGVTSFATGTSWGTMSILIPTAIPVAFALDGGAYGRVTVVSVAAVLDGAIFGDHCSPISDTTIMSSAGAACDHLAHVRTQLPYALTVAAVALGAGYLPCGLGAPSWTGMAAGAGVLGLLFLGLWISRGRGTRL